MELIAGDIAIAGRPNPNPKSQYFIIFSCKQSQPQMLTFFIIAIIFALGLTPAIANADVQYYKGDKAVGVIISEPGFGVVLDEYSKVIVVGNGVGGGNGSEVSTGEGNETTEVSTNQTGPSNIEIPHIGSYPITYYNGTELENITSSTEVVEIVTGVNVTEVPSETTTTNSTTVEEEEITEIVNEGLGCLSGDELRKLIQLLGLFSH